MKAEFRFPENQKNGLISDKQRCKDHSHNCHQFYQDVECRACGALERVPDRITGETVWQATDQSPEHDQEHGRALREKGVQKKVRVLQQQRRKDHRHDRHQF